MLEILDEILTGVCQVEPGSRLVVGVSGGTDSLALLDALFESGWDVISAHFNHRLRASADEDEAFVLEFCRQRSIVCETGSADTSTFSEENSLNTEEAARMLRYRFLFETALTCKAAAVAVAHQADDQTETVLMHLLRGAGLDGLTGMAYRSLTEWHAQIPLIRPLLGMWREELETYCAERGLNPRMDESNLDTGYRRNLLRHEVIPALEAVEPNLKDNLLRMTEVLQGDQQILDEVTEKAWSELLEDFDEDELKLDRAGFLEQSSGMQRRILRRGFALFSPGLSDIGYEAIERARGMIALPPATGQSDLFQGLRLSIQDGSVSISKWEDQGYHLDWPQIDGDAHVLLPHQGAVLLPNGWQVSLESIDRAEIQLAEVHSNPDRFTAYLDAAAAEDGLVLRTREDGDRYHPLGMDGRSMKVADLMVNTKLPRKARARYPLVCAGEKIVWVPGVQPAEFARVTEETRQVVKIVLDKGE